MMLLDKLYIGEGAAAADDAGAGAGAAGGGAAEQLPDWATAIQDENLRNEVWSKVKDRWTGYDDLDKFKKENEPNLARFKEYDEFYNKRYLPFAQQLAPYEQDLVKLLAGQAKIVANDAAAAAVTSGNANADPFAGYDALTPREQAQKMAEILHGQYISPGVKGLQDQMTQTISAKETQFNNYLRLLTTGIMEKFANPDYDFAAHMQEAMNFSTGNFDPLAVAKERVTQPALIKKQIEEAYNRGRKDAALEQTNKLQAPGVGGAGVVPIFKQKAVAKVDVERAAREKAAAGGIPWV